MLKRFYMLLVIVLLPLIVYEASAMPWHSGKALVLYTKAGNGWVQQNYKENQYWAPFRDRFPAQGWSVDFATNVNDALLRQYDALFILTPIAVIPDSEVSAIAGWVRDGGQLLITQDEMQTYANKLVQPFGVTYTKKPTPKTWSMTMFDYNDNLTTSPHTLERVFGDTVQDMSVSPPAKCLGWNDLTLSRCYLAVNEQVGSGIVVFVGEESMWLGVRFNGGDNSDLLDNVLKRFGDHSSFSIPPIANAGGPYSGVEGSPIAFDASRSIDPDGSIVLYEWDWDGDGIYDNATASPRITHVFPDDFDGSVFLRATDEDGVMSLAGATVHIANVPPTAHGDGPYFGEEGRPIQLQGRATDPGIETFSYQWDFNYDGRTFNPDSNDQNATATYDDEGVFTVALRVLDDDGGISAAYIATVTVVNVAPTVTIAPLFTDNEGAPVAFTLSITDAHNDTHTVLWDFGDDSPPIPGTSTVTHRYGHEGDYSVSVTVRDDDGATTIAVSRASISNVPPAVTIVGATPTKVRPQVVVTFIGNYTDPGWLDTHTVVWDFGDGTRIADGGLTVTHSYISLISPRTYTITLTVTDDGGASGSARVFLVPEHGVPLPYEWMIVNALILSCAVSVARLSARRMRGREPA